MGFFYNDQRAAKPKREAAPAKAKLEDIPVRLLREMSCSVCPRDKDRDIRTPKMEPEGPPDAPVYLLGASPSREDDEDDCHWNDKATAEVYAKFGKGWMRDMVRSNYAVQCRGEEHVAVTECCRGRAERDIAECRPRVVVTIGDAPLRWATGVTGTAVTFRGSLFASVIGGHPCWVYPILHPNYVHKKNKGRKSEYELALEHDVRWIKDNYDRLPEPVVLSEYDRNVEVILGDQPGDIHRLEKRLAEIARYPRSGLDYETNGLRPYMLRHPMLLTAAVGTSQDTLAFPLQHPEGWGTAGREQRAMELFADYLRNSGRKACHNLGMELEWTENKFGPEILRRTEWDDTMASAYVLDERPGTKGLNIQTRMEFGFFLKDQSRVDVSQPEWWLKHPLRDILRYNGMDTKWTDALRDRHMERLAREPRLMYQYERHVRLAPTLVLTQAPGLPVDMEYVRKMDRDMTAQLAEIEVKIARCDEVRAYERKHGRFSPTNPDHVLRLMKDLGREEVKQEDREGNVTYTTAEEALSTIPKSEVPSARLVLDHREVSKLHGTYVLPAIAKKWICTDGRIRSQYSSLKTATSRLQSEDVNAQNFPKRKHKYVRGMVYAGRGYWLVPCDYGQIEFRVVGMASGDPNLVKYCWTGYDVHKYWAQRMIAVYPRVQDWILSEFDEALQSMRAKDGKEYDEDKAILKTLRQEAKNGWVFPQFFGSTTRSCAARLHLPDDVADELGGEFWDEFREVKKWQETEADFYARHLYVETLGGHRRRGPMSYNELINLKVQGSAAEIVQAAHNALSERADRDGDPELNPILNVHDDLTFLMADGSLADKVEIIAREMCTARFDWVNVPLVVEVSAGARWDGAEELKVYRSDELFGHRNPYA